MRKLADGWDNDDVHVRPSKQSRPRTKTRPAHANAVEGFVTTVDRGRYTCLVSDERVVIAMRARELRRQPIVVGDQVDLVGDLTGGDGTLARIVRIHERRSVLRRSADDTDPAERVLVANADALLIVTATVDPPPRTGFIDRCLVAAYAGHLHPMLLVTKTDLADPTELLAPYRDLDLTVLMSGMALDGSAEDRTTPEGRAHTAGANSQGSAVRSDTLDGTALEVVRRALAGQVTALVGHSGVGKSTLVNALVPQADRAIGTVTGVGKGRHTSSSAIALRLPDGGWIVDTPGVRSFGLAHVTSDDLLEGFDDLLPATVDCAPNCTHDSTGIGCALDDLVARGGATIGRLESFRRLVKSRADEPDSLDE